MESSNNMKELQQKFQYLKRLIEDHEKTEQELNSLVMGRPKFTPPLKKQNTLNVSQKPHTYHKIYYPNVSKFKSKYVINKTKVTPSVSNIPFQNKINVQYKNAKTTLINKINSPKNVRIQYQNAKTILLNKINSQKNDLSIQYKNAKTTLINKINSPKNATRKQCKNTKTTLINKVNPPKNVLCNVQEKKSIHATNSRLKLDILAPKCSTELCSIKSSKLNEIDKNETPKESALKVVDVSKMIHNCNNIEKTLRTDNKMPNSCSSKPSHSYSQILSDIISLTEKLKQSTKSSDSYETRKKSFVNKAIVPIEKHPLANNEKNSVLSTSCNLKIANKDKLCTLKNVQKSNSIDPLKFVQMNKTNHLQIKNLNKDARSSTILPQGCNLSIHASTSLSKTNEDLITRENSNTKIFSSQYKVVNKNIGSHIKHSATLKLAKNKTVDFKSISVQNVHGNKKHSPKVRNVLNSKYKIINKAIRKSLSNTSIQSGSSKKNRNVYKLVNNSSNIHNQSFKSGNQISKIKTGINKTPKIKACEVVNITPIFKPCAVKNKANMNVSNHKNSIQRRRVLSSKYKVVNKFSTPKRSIFVNKSMFQFNSQKKLDRIQSTAERIIPIHKNSTHKSVLLKRLYKSRSKIINKNSSPANQTARMIKTKYVALYKQRSLPPPKQFMPLRSKLPKGYYLRRPYYSKPRHVKKRQYAAFYNPHSIRFLTMNRYSKINVQMKRSSLHKQRFSFGKYSYGNKLVPSHGGTFYKHSKPIAPVSQILASRVLNRSINQAVIKSTKKNLMKINTYCMFYNRFGKCNKGIKCSFIHDPSKIAVCTRFLRGTCKSENCPFSHEVNPGKMALCTYYLLGSCTKDKCPYRHESLLPNSDLCKEFVQGYCSKGRKCDKAHILICPHYVKGSCDKGDKCLFPHPPQKTKKIIPQDVEVSHAKELEEQFLENVNRYFEAFTDGSVSSNSSESPENCPVSVVVRRSRLLPEQPSFIPLSQSMEQLDGT